MNIQVVNKLDKAINIGGRVIEKGESVLLHTSLLTKSEYKDIKPNKYGVIVIEKINNDTTADIDIEKINDIEELKKIAKERKVSLKGISTDIEKIKAKLLANK